MGYCVLLSVEGIENLGEYFRLTSNPNVVTPFELKGVKCINNDDMQTELSATVNVVGSTEVSEQYDVSMPNFEIISNILTEQSESRAKSRKYRNCMKKTNRQNELAEQREARLAKMREYNDSHTAKETTEQRNARLAKMREYNNSKRKNETTEQREARLAKERERKRASRKRASSQKQCDVEENPGPRTINGIVDHTYTVHADFNQGNELKFGMNAGKQCVAMSLCAIVYKEIKSVNIWDRLMLNSILICGDSLYSFITQV